MEAFAPVIAILLVGFVPFWLLLRIVRRLDAIERSLEVHKAASKERAESLVAAKGYDLYQKLADDAVAFAEQRAKVATGRGQPDWTATDKKEAAIGFLESQSKALGHAIDGSMMFRLIESAVQRAKRR